MDEVREAQTSVMLSPDEALVLFEAASKLTEAEAVEAVLDEAEMQRLHDLVSGLESQLPAVLAPDYAERVAQAKARLAG